MLLARACVQPQQPSNEKHLGNERSLWYTRLREIEVPSPNEAPVTSTHYAQLRREAVHLAVSTPPPMLFVSSLSNFDTLMLRTPASFQTYLTVAGRGWRYANHAPVTSNPQD